MKTFSKSITEIIRQRYSCRTYLERPIEHDLQLRIVEYAAALGSGPFGGKARFELIAAGEDDRKILRQLGTYGFIKGAAGFLVGATRDGEEKLEDFGWQMERLILLATDLGLGTCWLGGTFTKSSFAKKISARSDELIPAVVAIGYIARQPRTTDRFIRRGAQGDRRFLRHGPGAALNAVHIGNHVRHRDAHVEEPAVGEQAGRELGGQHFEGLP